MREVVATYTARAAEKMRCFGLKAGGIQVFFRTNEFNDDPKYSNSMAFEVEATADSFRTDRHRDARGTVDVARRFSLLQSRCDLARSVPTKRTAGARPFCIACS